MSKAIALNQLQFAYPHEHKNGNAKRVLDIPQWQFSIGQKVFLHGSSGSGKSTLLNLLSGTLSLQVNPNNSGQINVLGQPLHSLSNAKKDAFSGLALRCSVSAIELDYVSISA